MSDNREPMVHGVPLRTYELSVEISQLVDILSDGGHVPNSVLTKTFKAVLDEVLITGQTTLEAQARMIARAKGIKDNQKIQWIKEVRVATGLGLKEAKELVDRVYPEVFPKA